MSIHSYKYSTTTNTYRIKELLKSLGELTIREMMHELNLTYSAVSNSVFRMSKDSKRGGNKRGKEVYIVRYTWENEEGMRIYRRPVFALGNKPDAKPPKPLTDVETTQRYYQKRKVMVNSVFALGTAQARRKVPKLNHKDTHGNA